MTVTDHKIRFAQKLRKNMTDAETVLWNAVRARRCNGLKFRRQVPISWYVVDFLCMEKSLVIEIDGGIHDDQEEYDAERRDITSYDLPMNKFLTAYPMFLSPLTKLPSPGKDLPAGRQG